MLLKNFKRQKTLKIQVVFHSIIIVIGIAVDGNERFFEENLMTQQTHPPWPMVEL